MTVWSRVRGAFPGIFRGRLGAVLLAFAATATVWFLFLREDAGDGADAAEEVSRGVSEPVRELVRGLSVEEQVDQVLLLGFEGTDSTSPVFAELRQRQLGGLLVQEQNWVEAGQLQALNGELRATAAQGGRIPPLIVAAQEGGSYRSFPDLPPAERQLEIGDRGSLLIAEQWARSTGESLRTAGFDLNLFPLADVATLDSPVADRAFSDDAEVAAEMTAAAVRGCRTARIACATPHFPGLGAASQDTNHGPATVSLDAMSLAERDLAAFRAAFSERVHGVVLSLAFYAAYDAVTPAAMVPEIATDLLRRELDYPGLAITDDLGAGAVKATHSVPAAAAAGVDAGADMVQIGSVADQAGVRDAILRAVRSGQISETRLADAAGRVLELKREIGIISFEE
jgi:beta-N-acetylhexosaminidase